MQTIPLISIKHFVTRRSYTSTIRFRVGGRRGERGNLDREVVGVDDVLLCGLGAVAGDMAYSLSSVLRFCEGEV